MRLIIVSNRLPFTVSITQEGPCFTASAGGVTTGLSSYLTNCASAAEKPVEYLWFGWPGATVAPEHQRAVEEHAREHRLAPVFLSQDNIERFYNGLCNKTIWPLFHYFASLAEYDHDCWQEYRAVNALFAEKLLQELRPDDVVWIHDYQLMLLPQMIRARFPKIRIGFFLHIPFPSFELFRMLPAEWRTEIIQGVLGANVVGFHTDDYTRHFLGCVMRTLGYENQLGALRLPDRTVKVDTFPMGVDFERFARAAESTETAARARELRSRCEGQKIIFSVDRLDYTKGLINRLRGYDLFLQRHPEWHGKVTFVLSVAPSRTGVDSYQIMKEELERTVGAIVGRHGNVQWTPLIYQYANLGLEEIVARYRMCDVALITPLRDGMNLVAKEFLAARTDATGVLILSEMAGAAKEMQSALLVNPFNLEDFPIALNKALSMGREEQVERNVPLREHLRRQNVSRWAESFMRVLSTSVKIRARQRAKHLSRRARQLLLDPLRSAPKRILPVDDDGKLVPFVDNLAFH